MSESTRNLRLIALAAIVLCIVASLVRAGASQDKAAVSSLRVAVVDPNRIKTEYTYIVTTTTALQKTHDDTLLRLRTYQQNPLLPLADQKSLGDLAVAENSPNGLTPAQKTDKQKFLDQSKALLDQYTALQSKQVGALTQQDKDQLNDFTRRASDTDSRIRTDEQSLQTDEQKALQQLDEKSSADMRAAIAKVAKEKGYNLVLSSELAYYGENDVTDLVLAQLNKK